MDCISNVPVAVKSIAKYETKQSTGSAIHIFK